MSGHPLSRYQENEIHTMSAPQRVVFLYAHLLSNLQLAGRHAAAGQFEDHGRKILKAQTIVQELTVSLNHELGGDLAAQLAGLYAYFLSELITLSVRPDPTRLDRLTLLIRELSEAWQKAAEQVMAPEAVGVVG
jgi:flagellar protein FliS